MLLAAGKGTHREGQEGWGRGACVPGAVLGTGGGPRRWGPRLGDGWRAVAPVPGSARPPQPGPPGSRALWLLPALASQGQAGKVLRGSAAPAMPLAGDSRGLRVEVTPWEEGVPALQGVHRLGLQVSLRPGSRPGSVCEEGLPGPRPGDSLLPWRFSLCSSWGQPPPRAGFGPSNDTP